MKETREYLKKIGLPEGDDYNLPNSEKRFPDGAQYRLEVPGIQGPGAMKALLDGLDSFGDYIHRVTQTKGIMLLTDNEISEMLSMAKEYQVSLVLAIGPRASYDTSASYHTDEGQRMGYRLRGQEQIIRAIEEVKRASELGCHNFLVYDEGFLWIIDRMRQDGEIPKETKFKVSAHCGHGNPCSFKLLEGIGANSLNTVRDIQIPMLSSLRKAVDVPIDIHTENPKSSGGFIRHYEVPEMIRVGSPVYLKTGGSVAQTHNWNTSDAQAKGRAKQIHLVKRVIESYYPEAIISPKGSIS